MVKSSRTRRWSMGDPVCSMPPMSPALAAREGGIPNSETLPESGLVRPIIMSSVVVLPARRSALGWQPSRRA